MWIAHEITVKTARNFHFRTKNSQKWMILESREINEEKGSTILLLNYILSFMPAALIKLNIGSIYVV